MATAICIFALLLIGQAVIYWRKHKDDGGGSDGGMGSFIMSLGGGFIGVLLLIAAGIAQLIQ